MFDERPKSPHQEEARQDRQRQRDRHHEGVADVAHDEQGRQGADDQLLADRARPRSPAPDGSAGSGRRMARSGPPDRGGRPPIPAIFALIRRVTSSGFSPTRIRTTPPTASLPSFSRTDRRKAWPTWTVATLPTVIGVPPRSGDHGPLDVAQAGDPPHRSDQVFGVPLVDHPAAHARIRPGDGRIHFAQPDPDRPGACWGRRRPGTPSGAPPTPATSATPGTLAS